MMLLILPQALTLWKNILSIITKQQILLLNWLQEAQVARDSRVQVDANCIMAEMQLFYELGAL